MWICQSTPSKPDTYFVAGPKLDWFRMGGGVSERQWTDVMGVLKVQKEHLDMSYLPYWAEELGLSGLFTQACRDAGISTRPKVFRYSNCSRWIGKSNGDGVDLPIHTEQAIPENF